MAISKRRRKEGGFNGFEIIKKDIEKGTEKIRVGLKLTELLLEKVSKFFLRKMKKLV